MTAWGRALFDMRSRRKLTQKKLADAAGLSQPEISMIETGNIKQPTYDTLHSIFAALDGFPTKAHQGRLFE